MSAPLPRPLPPGFEIGRYVVEQRLAMGGMAELYLARARGPFGFSKRCALKFALQNLAQDPEFVAMFVHEARLLANLDHPNIAQVLDVGEFEGGPYFAMQYVHGRDLRQVMKALRGQPVELPVALRVASQVAAGLAYAHAHTDDTGQPLGIVHRDVSPANVMLSYQGDVKLVDFGVAKSTVQDERTRRGVIKGKAAYLAPEQARGKLVDHRTDVFALGILLFETTTGRRLFRGGGDFELLRKVVEGEFPSPHDVCDDYPDELADIVMHALQVEPDERYQSAAALRHDLEGFARKHGILASELDVAAMMASLFEVPSPEAVPETATNAVTPVALPTNVSSATSATGLGVAEELVGDEPSTSQTRVAHPGPHPEPLRVPGPTTDDPIAAASGSHTQLAAVPDSTSLGTYNPRSARNTVLAVTTIAVSLLGLTWGYRSMQKEPTAPEAPEPAAIAAPVPEAAPAPADLAIEETPPVHANEEPIELLDLEPVPLELDLSEPQDQAPRPTRRGKKRTKQPTKRTKRRPGSKDRAGPDSMYP